MFTSAFSPNSLCTFIPALLVGFWIQFLRAFTKLKHITLFSLYQNTILTKYLQITKTNVSKCAVLKIPIKLETMLVLPHNGMHVIFVLLLSQSDT